MRVRKSVQFFEKKKVLKGLRPSSDTKKAADVFGKWLCMKGVKKKITMKYNLLLFFSLSPIFFLKKLFFTQSDRKK